ncbi:MAG TPA: retropepsin-like aspartic protease [Candidatus Eremiobacteraceae bacterium]|jgi:hypothetical protein|nr:retropepsin-like aspartic protease [Candidatus Eremiobacteraceae bacterium]
MIAVWIGGGLAAFLLAATTPAATATAPPPPASPSPLNALLERHRHALGHLPGMSASWSGVIDQNGTDIPFSASSDNDGRSKTVYSMPFGQRSEGNDDTTHWLQDVNGNVSLEPMDHRRPFLARLLGFNATMLDENVTWAFDGPLTMDGRPVIRLHTKLASFDVVVYVDARTALIYGVEIGPRSIRYVDYGSFGGLTMPVKIVEQDEQTTLTTTISSVAFPRLAAADFAAPTPRKPEFPAGQSDVGLDFDSPHSLIVINVKVNGTLVKFLLDSGSSASLIDIDEARLLKLPMAGDARVAGATVMRGSPARAESLELAGVKFAPFIFEAVPLGLPASIRGFGIQGILGYDVLAQLVARIDYGRARMRLIAPSSFTYAGTGAVIALDASSRLPRVATTLGEKDPATFTVDTGSDSGLIVYQDFAQAHARDFMRPGDLASDATTTIDPHSLDRDPVDPSRYFSDLTQANGAGGSIHVKTAFVSRLNIGRFSVEKIFTEIVLQPTGAFTPSASDGLLGAGVLSKFGAVFLDYPGGRFILER